jgi:membrane fusion protein, multidrug efflux system
MASPTDEPRGDKDRAWHEWMGVAVGLTGLLAIMATVVSVVALASTNSSTTTVTQAAAPAATASATKATQAALPAPQTLKLSMKADDEHGRLGPDKQWHDAVLPGNFTVHAGSTVTVTVANYDGGPHTITAPMLGVNQVIPSGSDAHPKIVSFKFTAPSAAGKYQWWCAVPCDPWAMKHNGFMRGTVTVIS